MTRETAAMFSGPNSSTRADAGILGTTTTAVVKDKRRVLAYADTPALPTWRYGCGATGCADHHVEPPR